MARRYAWTGRLLVSPAIVLVAGLVLFPLGFAVYISLTNWPLVGPYHYIGAQNYTDLGSDTTFHQAVQFTLLYTGLITLPILVVGYAMALFVRSGRRGALFFRTLFFLPFVVGLTTESYMLLLEVQPNSGAVNYMLAKVDLTDGSTAWLVHSHLALAAICVMVIWYSSGFTMVLLMAGMQNIAADLYEAASVDGANWWDREWRITIPLLRRTIALSLIISVIGTFLAFNEFYILTQGGPGTSTDTVVMWIYQTAFTQLRLGSATAMSIVVVVVVAIISAVQFVLLQRNEDT